MGIVSIYDNDLNNYLVENKREIEAFETYLHFRGEEFLGEWWSGNENIAPVFHKMYNAISEKDFIERYDELFAFWVSEVSRTKKGIEFIKEDITACNFTLES